MFKHFTVGRNLMGEILDGEDIVAAVRRVTGRNVRLAYVTITGVHHFVGIDCEGAIVVPRWPRD